MSAPTAPDAAACCVCDGLGFLPDQSYGEWSTRPGDTIRSAQRCDACEMHDGDIAAAVAFAFHLNRTGPTWFTTIAWVDPDGRPHRAGIGAVNRDALIAQGTDVVVLAAGAETLERWREAVTS